MCPPPRSLALEAHGCFMVPAPRANRIQGCGATIAPDSELPSDRDLKTICCISPIRERRGPLPTYFARTAAALAHGRERPFDDPIADLPLPRCVVEARGDHDHEVERRDHRYALAAVADGGGPRLGRT
jgi:hypothetical protein